MSSFLCFICHSTVNAETSEESREKYREVVGMNLCPDSQLCHICCHILNKLSLFRSICLKRSLEYPVLFSEKGTINLHKSDTELVIVCREEACNEFGVSKSYQINYDSNDSPNDNDTHNQYVALEDKFTDYFNPTNTQYHVQSETDDTSTVKEEFNTNVDDSHCELNEVDMFDDNPVATEATDEEEDTYTDRQLPTETVAPFETVDSTNNDEIDETEPKINEELYNENDEIEDKEPETNEGENYSDIDDEDPRNKHFNVILSVKEQKAELEARRKEKKYTDAEFKCFSCALPFLFKDTYQAHMMRHEESNGAHKCGVCALRFATQALLRTHERVHATRCGCGCARRRRCGSDALNTTQRFACHLCGNLLKNANGLQQHLRRVHASRASARRHACNVCGDSFRSHASLYTHMIKHINRKFPCEQCPAVYSSPYTLATHAKRHRAPAGDGAFACVACSAHYDSARALAQHQRTARAHLQRDRLLECPVCKRICPNQRSLTLHVQAIHSNRKDQACPHCEARYSTRKSLLRHIASHTKKPPQKTAVCHLCGNGFKDKSKLNRHLRNVCEKAKLEEQLASLYE